MNIQNTAEANYFNDVFADDDNYSESQENSPEIENSPHNEEIDDIGYQISEKKKLEKPKVEEKKDEEPKVTPKQKEPKEESKYNDRIKPSGDSIERTNSIENEKEKPSKKDQKEKKDKPEKPQKDDSKPSKSKKKASEKLNNDIKVSKAKDGLNILIPDPPKNDSDVGHQNHPNQENFNQTQKLPANLISNLQEDENYNQFDVSQEHSNVSINKCKDQIDHTLKQIEEEKEKVRLENEKLQRTKKPSEKKSKSKSRSHAPKSNRDGYGGKKKRPNSHKKRGSTSNMHEQIKKKMGFINSHSSRGRAKDQFVNYSLDEIHHNLQVRARNYNTSNGKGKKRLNKSFENVFGS